jgi:hypothetical protein
MAEEVALGQVFLMGQEVSRRPLTKKTRVQSQATKCGIYGRRSGSGTGISHGSGGQSLATDQENPGSDPGQKMWDFWRTKWHWDRYFSKYFGFPFKYHSTNTPHSSTYHQHYVISAINSIIQYLLS